jgi:hypothetical protein
VRQLPIQKLQSKEQADTMDVPQVFAEEEPVTMFTRPLIAVLRVKKSLLILATTQLLQEAQHTLATQVQEQ